MIILQNIRKFIKQTPILKGIDLHIKKGEFVAIIGQSGSGKTSLLNIIGTLDEPSEGKYFLDNFDITTLEKDEKARIRREKIGFIFQRYNLLTLLNSVENVALPSIYKGLSKDERRQKAIELLNFLGLNGKENSLPNELSGGQQQRVSIARALINGGELILADEPTGALDSKSGEMVLEILQHLNKQGHTIVLVTHDKNIAEKAKRIIEIKDGEIISDSSTCKVVLPSPCVMEKEEKNIKVFKANLIECFKMSITSILAHKLRSLLTMLGIIIGIASVICVIALGLGAQEQILSSISAIGTNTLEVRSGRGLGDTKSGKIRLNMSDLAMLKNLPFLEAVEADMGNKTGTVTYKSQSLKSMAYGVGEHYLKLRGLVMIKGRFINNLDIKESTNVAVIDENVLRILFENANASDIIGKNLIFEKQPLKIIGVLKNERWQYSKGSENIVRIYTPYTTLSNKITGSKDINAIVAKVKDGIDPSLAENIVNEVMKVKRGKKDFYTRNFDEIKKTREESAKTSTLLISSIALVSLIVGGIGVMNIMLVSVSERTREIGIRMAIGAKKEDILIQFLIEAVLICSIGAILGILFSFGIIAFFNALDLDFKMILSINSIFLGLLSSVFIGIVFGFFPAKNAANLNPINALNKE